MPDFGDLSLFRIAFPVCCFRDGQGEGKPGPLTEFGCRRNGSPVQLHQLAAHRQPQTGPPVHPLHRTVDLLEGFENAVHPVLRYADAGVRHRDHHLLSRYLCGNGHHPRFGEFDGIAHQVEKDLLDPVFIRIHHRCIGSDKVQHLEIFPFDQGGGDGNNHVGNGGHIHRHYPQVQILVTELGKIENIVDQVGQPLAAGGDHGEVPDGVLRKLAGSAVYKGFRQTDDAGQRCPQLMGGVGEKLVFEFVKPLQFQVHIFKPVIGFLKFLLHPFPLGDLPVQANQIGDDQNHYQCRCQGHGGIKPTGFPEGRQNDYPDGCAFFIPHPVVVGPL